MSSEDTGGNPTGEPDEEQTQRPEDAGDRSGVGYDQVRYDEARYDVTEEPTPQLTTPAEAASEGPLRPIPEESLGAGIALLPTSVAFAAGRPTTTSQRSLPPGTSLDDLDVPIEGGTTTTPADQRASRGAGTSGRTRFQVDGPLTTRSPRTSGIPFDIYAAPDGDLAATAGFPEYNKDILAALYPMVQQLRGSRLTDNLAMQAGHRLQVVVGRDPRTLQLTFASISDGLGQAAWSTGTPTASLRRSARSALQGVATDEAGIPLDDVIVIVFAVTTRDGEYHEQVYPLTRTGTRTPAATPVSTTESRSPGGFDQ